jgi:lysophospholipase L1-like esterase
MNAVYRVVGAILGAALLGECSLFQNEPSGPSTIAALGDSITMGIQDAGLVADHQYNCYPYLVAKQMGQARGFRQPLVGPPGIGVPPYAQPLDLHEGFVTAVPIPVPLDDPAKVVDWFMQEKLHLLQNPLYSHPYNNLGVNGARMDDLNVATGYGSSYSKSNFFYDIVLRNLEVEDLPLPHFADTPTTAVQQIVLLDPEYILLWIGNNDILGYVLTGGEEPERINPSDKFEEQLREIIDDLQQGVPTAKIVLANIPKYLPFGYALDKVFVDGVPRLFDPKTLKPINFDDEPAEDYVPLYIEAEDGGTVKHILLTGAAGYIEEGLGIPPGLEQSKKNVLMAEGVIKVPDVAVPMTKDLVFTNEEESLSLSTIAAFNSIIQTVAAYYGLPVVDVNRWMQPGGGSPLPDDSCLGFALVAQDNTIFSLDGIHPSNYGHAFIANEFIATMNAEFGLHIPKLNPENYKGQYSGKALVVPSLKAIRRLEEMYAPSR